MRRVSSGYLFIVPAMTCISFLMAYPIAYNVYLSLHDVSFATLVRGGSPWIGLKNYRDLVQDPLFARISLNTVIFLIGSTSLQFVIGLLLALLFEKKFPLNNLYRGLIILPWFVPVLVSGTMFRWFFSERGLINSLLWATGLVNEPVRWITSADLAIYSVTLANVWLGIPFNFIMLLTGLQSIPSELYECAEIDGAKEWQKALHISIPLLRPVILATFMLGTIFTVKVFDLVWVITKGGPGGASHLFSTFAYSLAFEQFRFGYGSAVVVAMMLMVTLLAIVLHRSRVG